MSSKKVKDRQILKHRMVIYKTGNALAHYGRCAMCSREFPDVCFHFHHIIEGTPINEIIRQKRYDWNNDLDFEFLAGELSKTIMLCACCHAVAHYGDNVHG